MRVKIVKGESGKKIIIEEQTHEMKQSIKTILNWLSAYYTLLNKQCDEFLQKKTKSKF